jgi:hypothetical protein
MSHLDWMPTLLAAAGDPDIKNKLKKGYTAGNKKFKVHLDGSENGASIGLEYVYRISPLFSIGGLGEYAGGDFNSWVIGIPLYIRPYAGWFFRLAPGLEFEDSETNFLFRVGSGYEFELMPRWLLSPEINVDFVDGDTKLVYGLTLSWEF